MTDAEQLFHFPPHDHVFLGKDHDKAEKWARRGGDYFGGKLDKALKAALRQERR